jgi:hypothetical protein
MPTFPFFRSASSTKSKGGRGMVLCAPAKLYLYISVAAFAVLGAQIAYRTNSLSLRDLMCNGTCSQSDAMMFAIIELAAVLFWTWVLYLICKDGHPGVAWALVLAPILLAILAGVQAGVQDAGPSLLRM